MQIGAVEKCRKNETCLSKWLALELRQIRLANYFLERGIMQICLYGYGTLGKLVVQALRNSPIRILCVIDKKAEEGWDIDSEELHFYKEIPKELKNEFILFSVIWDRVRIVEELKAAEYQHVLSLEHIIDVLSWEVDRKYITARYPELKKYADISNMDNIQVANFGTGMGYYGFCYDGLGVPAFNFSLPQQSLEFDYKLITYYQDQLATNCKICLVLSYCIFLAAQILEVDEVNERYYSILPREEVVTRCNTAYEAFEANRQSWCGIPENKKNSLELLKAPDEKKQEKQTQEILHIWKEQLGIRSYENPILTSEQAREMEVTKKWLKMILAFCQKKQWEPVIIISPMSQKLLDKISLRFRQIYFYDILQEIVNENILILDYSEDAMFCNPSFYGEPCFLIKEKARLFTEDVLQRIGVMGENKCLFP